MTTQTKTSRRAMLGGMAALPALALAAPALAAPQGDDAELLARFDAYCRAWVAFNGYSDEEDVPEDHPIYIEYYRALEAMDEAPIPTTAQGAIVRLRFALEKVGTARDVERACLTYTPAARAALFRRSWDAMHVNEAHIAAAIIGLEAIHSA